MSIHGLLTSLSLAAACACSNSGRSSDRMVCLELPKTVTVGDVHVRRPDEKSRDLLVARGATKFFDHKNKKLALVDSSRWKDAKGRVTDYSSRGPIAQNVIPGEIDLKLVLLLENAQTRQIPTKGAWVMRVSLSVEGKLLAALTRDKEPKKGMKEPSAHFVELFTYPDGKPVGEPYELPCTDFNEIEPLCWSSGDMHLVISTYDGKHVCVIEVPKEAEEE